VFAALCEVVKVDERCVLGVGGAEAYCTLSEMSIDVPKIYEV